MTTTTSSDSIARTAEIRARIDHPIIDGDGHSTPFQPLFEEYVREFGGAAAVDRYRKGRPAWQQAAPNERMAARLVKNCWGFPTRNTLDYMTGKLPALMVERLEEIGIDFAVIYPSTQRVGGPDMENPELRQAMCRAMNTYQADIFRPHAFRIAPAAVIPMASPAEAIEELDYTVNTLKMKVIQCSSYAIRKPEETENSELWDVLGLDSMYDYDVVWQKCKELGVSPSFHSGTKGMASRRSVTNAVYNHIGHFATASEPLCKALVLGGVTYRFPDLNFLFLESGVGWACALFSDLVGHWKKRNVTALRDLDPDNLDFGLARDLVLRYGNPEMVRTSDRIAAIRDQADWMSEAEFPDDFDDFRASGIKSVEDIVNRFVPNFYFGCEGDDPLNTLAFADGLLPKSAHLKAVYGSDISHWDVPDISEVLEEAYELVDEDKITPANFREFAYLNPAKFHTLANPSFFEGTAVADAVRRDVLNGRDL